MFRFAVRTLGLLAALLGVATIIPIASIHLFAQQPRTVFRPVFPQRQPVAVMMNRTFANQPITISGANQQGNNQNTGNNQNQGNSATVFTGTSFSFISTSTQGGNLGGILGQNQGNNQNQGVQGAVMGILAPGGFGAGAQQFAQLTSGYVGQSQFQGQQQQQALGQLQLGGGQIQGGFNIQGGGGFNIGGGGFNIQGGGGFNIQGGGGFNIGGGGGFGGGFGGGIGGGKIGFNGHSGL